MLAGITRRLSSLVYLTRPLAFIFVGIVLLSLGVAFLLVWMYQNIEVPAALHYVTLPFLPGYVRGLIGVVLGLAVLAAGIWNLSGVVVIPLQDEEIPSNKLVIGYKARKPPRIVVLSGGVGMLILANLSKDVRELTCITPLQDSIEYYYRASSMLHLPNVHYIVPTPETPLLYVRLDDGTISNVMHINHQPHLAERHAVELFIVDDHGDGMRTSTNGGRQSAHTRDAAGTTQTVSPSVSPSARALPLTRPAYEALRDADVIVLGPGSLFESVLPNLLIDDLRSAIQQSKARKIYVCNLMTEPGLTTGFSVGEHIRQIKRYGEFSPDYVLVNVQRIESEVQKLYAEAHQAPVYLTPEEYEETAVPTSARATDRQLFLEGSIVIEADLASSVIQYNASVKNPGTSWAVRVLRHDPEKLTTAILELLRRE